MYILNSLANAKSPMRFLRKYTHLKQSSSLFVLSKGL